MATPLTDEETAVLALVPAGEEWTLYDKVVDGCGLPKKKAVTVIAVLVIEELEYRHDGTWSWLRRRAKKPTLREVESSR